MTSISGSTFLVSGEDSNFRESFINNGIGLDSGINYSSLGNFFLIFFQSKYSRDYVCMSQFRHLGIEKI